MYERHDQPLEISIPARLCNGSRYHSVGDMLTYKSGMWMVKGFYFGPTQSGERDLYYILSDATGLARQFDSA
jgi:hypothetical protein